MARVGFVPASDLPANVARIYEQYATGYGPFRNQVAVFAHVPSAVRAHPKGGPHGARRLCSRERSSG